MRNVDVTVAGAVLRIALNGSWLLRGAAQKAAPTPGAKTAATNPPLFVDVTDAAGIDFRMTCGGEEKLYIVETQCGGAAAFDYDNDGWMDILLVDGSTLADYRAGKCHPPRLYHNNHDGTFTDVSAKSGVNFCGWGYGVAIGALHHDGWEDAVLPALHGSAPYPRNHRRPLTH